MILLDCGNSRIKAQHLQGGRLRASFSCSYKTDWSQRLTGWLQAHPDNQVYLCSVLDNTRQAELDSCLADCCGPEVVRFTSQAQALGVVNGYDDPDRLGADRWMALLAAAAMTDGDCIVIDAGSAITVDLLSANGRHLGGAILPGVNTTNEAFRRIFSHIDFDRVDFDETAAPGCSTESAIRIDYDHRSTETLPALVNRWMKLFDSKPRLLLSGGDAVRMQALLDPGARIVPDLVFRGLYRLATQ